MEIVRLKRMFRNCSNDTHFFEKSNFIEKMGEKQEVRILFYN